jgi:hypothetical protein
MAFTSETLFEDITPSHQRTWDNAGYLAPSASEVKAGTLMEFAGSSTLLLEVADTTPGTPDIVGMLAQTVRNLDGGPIEGIRDLVTTDRDYSDVVTLVRGSNVTKIRLGRQDATDTQAGWEVGAALTHGALVYPSLNGAGACDGGVSQDSSGVTVVGRSLSSPSAATDILTMIFHIAR